MFVNAELFGVPVLYAAKGYERYLGTRRQRRVARRFSARDSRLVRSKMDARTHFRTHECVCVRDDSASVRGIGVPLQMVIFIAFLYL